ncbi:hypothetical protein KIP88_33325 [Bradyrhizobium sp. SRL28]|uniref:hypothetical protein n=1 Tax=Bradyrhizobium sp. SRL28 TaxID=2836178 RepID=UPI001BDF2B04|nr:hypothetical protein [Bradyrhizobium sp. SRL28]MBT1515377.1 hypothetical protein [Bradyrhizobium sp. SRL28]
MPIAILVPLDKIRDREGKFAHLQIAAAAQFASDFGSTFRPALGGIERELCGLGCYIGRSVGLCWCPI